MDKVQAHGTLQHCPGLTTYGLTRLVAQALYVPENPTEALGLSRMQLFDLLALFSQVCLEHGMQRADVTHLFR